MKLTTDARFCNTNTKKDTKSLLCSKPDHEFCLVPQWINICTTAFKYLVEEHIKTSAYGHSSILGDLAQKFFCRTFLLVSWTPKLVSKFCKDNSRLHWPTLRSLKEKTESDASYLETTQREGILLWKKRKNENGVAVLITYFTTGTRYHDTLDECSSTGTTSWKIPSLVLTEYPNSKCL